MNAYYVEYPRDFANEYEVYITGDRESFESARPNARRISRAEAIRLGWSRPREAKRDGEQWYGGFYQDTMSDLSPNSSADAIAECLRATAAKVDEIVDARREYA